MIERFVELAQKHAPGLGTVYADGQIYLEYLEFQYDKELPSLNNAQFTITLLEYLKGLANVYKNWLKENPDENHFPKELRGNAKAKAVLDWNDWYALTPEAVMQACIDIWEAME